EQVVTATSQTAPERHTETKDTQRLGRVLIKRFGERQYRDVRFTPESGHLQCTSPCPLWAKSRHLEGCEFNGAAALHVPLPSLLTSAMGNENNSFPSSSCTRIDHLDHSSSKNVLVSNFNSCATTWACARAASRSASSVPSTS